MKTLRPLRILIFLVLFVWSVVVFFPLYWMVSTAFKQPQDLFPTPTYLPWIQFQPSLLAFQSLFTEYRVQVGGAVRNSLVAATGSAVLATFLGALAGYGLVRFTYRLGAWTNHDIAFWFASQRMLPPVAVVFPFLVMYRQLNLVDNVLGLVVAYTVFNLPLAVWIMRNAFRAVPQEIEESALIDGNTRFGAFLWIALPLARPGLVASLLICFVFAWNEFLFGAMLTFQSAQTLPVLIAGQVTQQAIIWANLSALAIIAVLPVLIVGLVLQPWLAQGLAAGGLR
ncbi:MAG: putative transporter permease protein [Thermomicrobiales bacterium]|nr:putative transporter permease protein [Thermomicrobiales bacterium]